MNNLVSVIVTCYNHQMYIKQCLESIFHQSYQNIELIVYNDGSTDDSSRIIKETLKGSPFLRTEFIDKSNEGLVVTRNRALKIIEGDFFLFVDSDNFLEYNYVEELMNEATEENADIVYTRLVNAEDKSELTQAPLFNLQEFYIGNFIDSCSLVRRDKIRHAEYDIKLNYKKLEDYDFFFNLIVNHGAKAVPTQKTHLNYRVLENSMSARGDLKKYYETYSYILGKYYLNHPEIASKAMQVNFLRLEEMSDLESCYLNKKITIYFDLGNGFDEENKHIYPLHKEGSFMIQLPNVIKHIRIDFSELPIFLHKLSVNYFDSKKNLIPALTNGVIIEDGVSFTESDPWLVYYVEGHECEKIEVQYERYVLNDINSPLFLGNHLVNFVKKREEKMKKYDSLLTEYNAIINSRRWIILTKIINFFRRKS